MDALEQAMAVAKQFQDKLTAILDWLDKSEKKIKDMELIPTDEEKIQARIREHDVSTKKFLSNNSKGLSMIEVWYNDWAL